MKNRILMAFLLTVSFAITANAALKDRLVPIASGKVNIAVDTFIIGTHDRYIANIIRDLGEESLDDIGDTMRDVAALHGNKDLVLVEKLVFDKNAKRVSMVERYMAPVADPQTRLSIEPAINSDMYEAAPGTLGGILWDKVAGPDGLGRAILGEDPAPVTLAEDKNPVDAKRYAPIIKNQVGGIFLDKNSLKTTNAGCSAVIVEIFDYDAEVHFGGMAMQYTHQSYVDASYAVSTYEYSFEQLSHRRVRFTKFSADGKVIYSIRNPNLEWISADVDPMLPFALLTVRANLPEDVSKNLTKELTWFDEFMREAAKAKEEAAKAQEGAAETKEESQGKGTAK